MTCKCSKKGVCKWRNDNNKKINGAIYREYFCKGDISDGTTSGPDTAGPPTPSPITTGPATTAPTTVMNDPTAPVPDRCRDPNSKHGVLEHSDGTGGCPPKLVNWSLADFGMLGNYIGFDPNQVMGTHLDGRSYIGVGVGGESESKPIAQAVVTRFNICDDISKYGSEAESRATSLKIAKAGKEVKCEKHLQWTWKGPYTGKPDMLGGVAVSPDKKFIIAAGVRGSKTKDHFNIIENLLIPVGNNSTYFEILKVQKMVSETRCCNRSKSLGNNNAIG